MIEMKDPCSLRNKDKRLSAMGQAVQCWRGECLICGWAEDNLERRRADIRPGVLYTATDEELEAFIEKNDGILSRKSIEMLRRLGLRYYKVTRSVSS